MDPVSTTAAITALLGLVKGRGGEPSVSSTGLPPELQAELLNLLRMQGRRAARVEPIHEAAMAMASRLAPNYARSAMGSSASAAGSGGSVTPSYSGHGSSPVIDAFVNLVTNSADPTLAGDPTGPGSPDPFLLGSPSLQRRGPGIDPRRYDSISPGWRGFFSGNPGGAFHGGGVMGSGNQTGGDRRRGRGRAV